MAKKHAVNKPTAKLNDTGLLKEQLVREITSLERLRENVNLADNTVDFSMIQTYKEMIHCRREMLNGLP